MKIFFYSLREYDELDFCKKYSKAMGIEFGYSAEYPSPDNYDLASGYDGVSVTPCDFSAPVLEEFHKRGVRYILCRSIGYDHVDLQKAKELGMRVSNVTYPPSGVANYAIMLMMMACRKADLILRMADMQNFSLKGKIGRDISHCTIGVIGTGKIGATVIKHLSAFGCRILAYDLYRNPSLQDMAEYVSLEELYGESDIISLHTNANESNYHLLDEQAFSRMKKGVIIVNTARGKLIDTEALIHALEEGRVGGAALDVLEHEDGLYYYDRTGDVIKNPYLSILRSYPNVILSPHTAFYTMEDVDDMVKGCFESFYAFVNNLPTAHEVK
ncbi:MAG: D-isomer specific 2-hydroxyacid dehydrogenase family protein [Lachnospiraceae bacterium]|nr:D-isomer specific 2-hydroxyacid dehydrogenase family protein [Lachnospiraceae bacterium]